MFPIDQLESLSDDAVVLFIFASTICGAVASMWWERYVVPPLFLNAELRKEREIEELQRQADEVNTTDNIHLYGKAQRKVIETRKELASLKRARYGYTFSAYDLLLSPTLPHKRLFSDQFLESPAPRSAPITPPPPAGFALPSSSGSGTPMTSGPCTESADASSVNSPVLPVTPTPRSLLPFALLNFAQQVVVYVRFNLPGFVARVTRHGTCILAWFLWQERSALVKFPDCAATRLPMDALQWTAATLHFLAYGPSGIHEPPVSAGDTTSASLAPDGQVQTSDPLTGADKVFRRYSASATDCRVPHCSAFFWALVCYWVLIYSVRMFS